MKSTINKMLSLIVTVVMLLSILSLSSNSAIAATAPEITLGSASVSGGVFRFSNAVVTGDNIRTILISFSGAVARGDEIILPVAPPGFTVSPTSASNDYVKRINLNSGISTDAVQNYLRSVGFKISGVTQSVEITVTSESIVYDTYYNIDTQHHYQYIPDTTKNWIQAYNAAKSMTYMGRTGYLATIMSLEEDTFVNSLSGGQTGWLGGTILTNTGTSDGSLYYNGFNTNSVVSTGWYWACGPEKGITFYNVNGLNPATQETANEKDAQNTAYYYNWARGNISYEPNTSAPSGLPSSSQYETCLTTLAVTQNGVSNLGKYGTTFSWNDRGYTGVGTGTWDAKGYFVEYGNLPVGNDVVVNTAFATASGTLDSTAIELTNISWIGTSTYTCGIKLPVTAKMVTISVDSGYFTVPSLGAALTFLGGTSGTSYLHTFSSDTQFDSAVFSFTDVSAAEALLAGIRYRVSSMTPQTITATSSAVSPLGSDIYFEGHFYRFVRSPISWPNAVLAAGRTVDPYFGGRGYIATATKQAENSILLRLVDTGGIGSDHWYDAWMGGLWQRNTGSVSSPSIIRGVDGNEITFNDLNGATAEQIRNLLVDYSLTFADFNSSNSSTFIYSKPDVVRYYWLDGPEAGMEIGYNTANFAPWHVNSSGVQDEPNGGDFIYIGWQGAYWDDLSAYKSDNTALGFDTLDGYIVEFSGFDGGSKAGIIKETTKTTVPRSNSKAITAFSFQTLSPTVVGAINEAAKTISLAVPYGTNLSSLVPAITHTGVSISPAAGAAQNFTTTVTYTVTAEDGSTQPYTVTVQEEVGYIIEPINNQAMSGLTYGYASGTQEEKTITITRSGTGDLNNVAVALSGGQASSFVITGPDVTTLNSTTQSTTFTLKAKHGLAAGNYTEIVSISADNMQAVTFTVTQSVSKAVIADITFSNATFAYDGTEKSIAIVGTLPAGASVSYNSGSKRTNVGTSNATASIDGGQNYISFSLNATLTVTPRLLTITASDQSKTYGEAMTFAGSEFKTEGLVADDRVTSVTFVSDGAVSTAVVKAYDITPSAAQGVGLTNYEITYFPGTLTVTKADITGVTFNATFIYDGTEKSVVISGDLPVGASLASYTNNSRTDVGTSNATANILGGQNYNDLTLNGNLAITARPLTITANSQTKTYGETVTFAGTEFATNNLVADDRVTSVTILSNGAVSTAAVDTYAITPSAAQGVGLTNYNITYVPGALTVTKADIMGITFDNAAFAYDGTEKSIAIVGTLPAGASVSYNSDSKRTNVGTSNAIASIAGGQNYNSFTLNATLTVTPLPLTITANSQTKTYGETMILAGSEFITQGLVADDRVTSVTFVSDGAESTAVVETYAITPSAAQGLGLTNYDITYLPGTLTVTKADIMGITFSNATFTFDGTEKSIAISGVIPTGASVSYNNNRGTNADIHNATATISGGQNYNNLILNATLTIDARTISITATSGLSKVYGSPDPVFTYSADPLANGDSFTGSLSRAVGEDVGSYDIELGTLNAGSNYIINFTGADFAISEKPISVTVASDQSKTYGSLDPVFTYTSDPLIEGDSFTGALSRIAGEDVGSYEITQGSLSAGTNYDVSFAGENFAITKAAITLTADSKNKTYGAADPELTFSVDGGLYFEDTLEIITGVSLSTSTGAAATAGTHAIAISGGTAANYEIAGYVDGVLIVSKASLAVTANSITKRYGDADPALTYTVTGFSQWDDASIIEGSLVRASGESTGSYAITVGNLTAGDNYTISFTPGNFSIVARPQNPQQQVQQDADAIIITYAPGDISSSVTQDVGLPVRGLNGSVITWTSYQPSSITSDGTVTRRSDNRIVTLIARVTKDGYVAERTFTLTVIASGGVDLSADQNELRVVYAIGEDSVSVKSSVFLTGKGQSGTIVTWVSSHPDIITSTGRVTRPGPEASDVTITLTATLTHPVTGITMDKNFILKVLKLSDLEATKEAAANLTVDRAFAFDLGDTWESVTKPFTTLTVGDHNTTITWSSDKPAIRIDTADDGTVSGMVTRSSQSDTSVILTATISRGGMSTTKTFLLNVKKAGVVQSQTRNDSGRTASADILAGGSQQNLPILYTVTDDGQTDYVQLGTNPANNLTDSMDPTGDESGRTVTVDLTIDPTQPADAFALEIPGPVVGSLSERNASLELRTDYGHIVLRDDALGVLSQQGTDLYFRIVPIKTTAEQAQLASGAKNSPIAQAAAGDKDIVPVGQPTKIETNYSGVSTKVVIPFAGMVIPDANREAFFSALRVYIEHSDGTASLASGTVIYVNEEPFGLEISITKFSRFQIVRLATPVPPVYVDWEGPQPPKLPTLTLVISSSEGDREIKVVSKQSTLPDGRIKESITLQESMADIIRSNREQGSSMVEVSLAGIDTAIEPVIEIVFPAQVVDAIRGLPLIVTTPYSEVRLPAEAVKELPAGEKLYLQLGRNDKTLELSVGKEQLTRVVEVDSNITSSFELTLFPDLRLPSNSATRQAYLNSLRVAALLKGEQNELIKDLSLEVQEIIELDEHGVARTVYMLRSVTFHALSPGCFALVKPSARELVTVVAVPGYSIEGAGYSMAPCYYKGNDTYMPVRMLEAFGMEFEWDESTQSATLYYLGSRIELAIGSTDAFINGVRTPIIGASSMLLSPELAPGRTMIPLRFVSEHLGFEVHWEPNGTITVRQH